MSKQKRGGQNRAKPCRRTDAKKAAEQGAVRLRDEFEQRKRQAFARAELELDSEDLEILRLILNHPGITHRQIAELRGVRRRQTITERINKPKFQRALAEANRPAMEIIQASQARAARKIAKLIDHEDPRIALRAAELIVAPLIRESGDAENASFLRFVQEAYELATKGSDSRERAAEQEKPICPQSIEPASR